MPLGEGDINAGIKGGNDEAKAALKRAECPYVLKDKSGKVMTNLCF